MRSGTFGWKVSGVVEMRPDSLTVLLDRWVHKLVCLVKLLEWIVTAVFQETSGCKEVQIPVGEWRYAIAGHGSGAQCVMTSGITWMLK
jgi:hypothetical protein